ncbi:MAG: hypothetical protein K2X76_10995 [Sphingomonas sp.]|nr:hypothetical protein [Sphingomonas sp.]
MLATLAALLAAVTSVADPQTAPADPPAAPGNSQVAPADPPKPTPDQPDIIVEAERHLPRKAIDIYVGEVTQYAEFQIPRFHEPICPVVIGMDDRYAGYIVERIKTIARQLKLRVAPTAKCDANLVVVFAVDGAAFVRDVRAKRPDWLAGMFTPDVDRLARPGQPARAWSATSIRNEDGQPMAGGVMIVKSASILREPTRQYLDASFVVIEQAAATGLTLRQLADYAAMRGLARTREPAPGSGVKTILGLFDRTTTAHAGGITSTDFAYLQALYARKGEESGVQERGRIARRIRKGQE